MDESREIDDLLRRAVSGDEPAKSRLLGHYSHRLLRMVQLRMDPRLKRRVGASDIVQLGMAEADRRLAGYARDPRVSFYVWLRKLTLERLYDEMKFHTRQRRDLAEEIAFDFLSEGKSRAFVLQLADTLTTAGMAAERAELGAAIRDAIQELSPVHREVLLLRHWEELANKEVAEELGIPESTASNRYVVAIQNLRVLLERRFGGDPRMAD